MYLNDFDFDLPERLIAKHPLPDRDGARLLHLPVGQGLSDMMIRDLPRLARPGDVWVLNDTRVLPARLLGQKDSGGSVEILLIEPLEGATLWLAWGRANRPLKPGTQIRFSDGFTGRIEARQGKEVHIRLEAEGVLAAIEAHGHMPLPPYLARPEEEADRERYQTVFARHAGAVAAPTAGLHLTQALLEGLEAKGATIAYVTLHVGAGTFQPVQVERIEDHPMHEERYVVPDSTAELIRAARRKGGRVVAVGTTSLRTLEAACHDGKVQAGAGRTDIFIYPGYRFRVVDALLTNFHLPRSTLLMLVSALTGRDRVLDAYAHARDAGYRFYSYGDAMFVNGVPTS